jgi:aconitate hydratase
MKYMAENTLTVILAGEGNGTGSSRALGRQGHAAAGIIASTERDHRSNLVGMYCRCSFAGCRSRSSSSAPETVEVIPHLN